ncbi:ribosomal protein S18-alanine N-acetyltransferase [Ornithinimicrobium flavum]|uniref:ribosomal protein S18-alanine N-acetyltransferase n=1 Tax=Ornithinimicrobium flavum TaxID=1288636 RepID=UPI001EE94C83|nr:ribosomal protein S18-alanine N-acetyltransferase [Ornithinimicrobium flavum]
MSAVVLRDAHWRDIPAMARLERAAFPEDPWPEATFWAELAQRPRRSYVVAVTDGSEDPDHLLGQAGLDLAGDVADIMTVAVDAAARGRGVGARLLDALHARALASGADSVMLEVRADNGAALGLYRRHGYRPVRTRPGYYRSTGAPPVDALVLRKELVGHE